MFKSLKIILIITYLLLSINNYSQEKVINDKSNKYKFGIQLKNIIPNNFININKFVLNENKLLYNNTINNVYSPNFGIILRKNYTNSTNFELEMNYISRKYKLISEYKDSNIYEESTLSLKNFEIPITALFFVQLSKNIFLCGKTGIGINYTISDISSNVEKNNFIHYFSTRQLVFNIIGDFGIEYRTKNNSYYNISATYNVGINSITVQKTTLYIDNVKRYEMKREIMPSYFSINMKYYFK